MRTDFYFDSHGEGKIHGCRWAPEGEVKAVVQIIHGIAEFAERYDEFAQSGFFTHIRTEESTIPDTLAQLEQHFQLNGKI